MTAPTVPPERKEGVTVVVVASLKATAVVTTPDGDRQCYVGQLLELEDATLVLRLTDGALEATP